MFSTLVLCSIIALAFCCISLLYFYYSKLKHIAYLESQLMSLKMMFANYQNSVEYKLSTMLGIPHHPEEQKTHPNVMTVLDNANPNPNSNDNDNANPNVNSKHNPNANDNSNNKSQNNENIPSISKSPITKSVPQIDIISNLNPILTQLLPDDELMQNGPIPFFQIVSMSSNSRFTNSNNTQDITEITEITDDDVDCDANDISKQNIDIDNDNDIDIDIDMDMEIEELELERPTAAIKNEKIIVGHADEIADETVAQTQPEELNLELEDLEPENIKRVADTTMDSEIKTISINKKATSQILKSPTNDEYGKDGKDGKDGENSENVKTVNLMSNAELKLNCSFDTSLETALETSLDGIMDELEELSDIASVCDDTRTININTMTPADLSNLSVKELKDLCSKYKIKNKMKLNKINYVYIINN